MAQQRSSDILGDRPLEPRRGCSALFGFLQYMLLALCAEPGQFAGLAGLGRRGKLAEAARNIGIEDRQQPSFALLSDAAASA
jgi:hypothetical protein